VPDDTAPGLASLLAAIQERPDDGPRWLALASWYWDNGRDDEAAAVRVFWPVLRGNVVESEVPLHVTLRTLARNVARLGRRARAVEERSGGLREG
jgi:hypothetical protein